MLLKFLSSPNLAKFFWLKLKLIGLLYFYFSGSDGCLQSLPIGGSSDQAQTLHHVPNITNNTLMISIDSTHVALSAICSKSQEKGIGIWDTKYGTLLTWRKYPEDSEQHQVC